MDASNDTAGPGNSDSSAGKPRPPAANYFRTAFRYALPTAIVSVIIAACSGLLPPLPVVIVLCIGLLITASFIAMERPAVAATSAIATILLAVWVARPVVAIRAPDSSDRIYDRYFGIDRSEGASDEVTYKNIAIVTGTFSLDTWLFAALYHVKAGEIQEINAFSVGRTTNAIGAPHWVKMKITLAIGNRQRAGGRFTQLGSAGQSRGGGRGSELVNDVHPHTTKTFQGRLASGTKRVLYVEGDEGFSVDRTMTVEDFATKNNGNYLVVEIELLSS